MFEFSFIKKYLTPKKGQFSVSLIAILSIVVITLVVWLVVLFLSVTEGIEKSWLHKLTSLNAPLRLQPTKEYFSSYYYQIDKYSAASQYLSKTIGQKARSLLSDPYDPEIDQEIPRSVIPADLDSLGKVKDPVKEAISSLEELQKVFPGLRFQDVELSGAILRLDLLRQEAHSLNPAEMQSQLTNVSYLASFPEKNPFLTSLLLPPRVEDLNHLIFLESRASSEKSKNWQAFLPYVHIQKLKPRTDLWHLPFQLLPEKQSFYVEIYQHSDFISHLILPTSPSSKSPSTIERRGQKLFLKPSSQEAEYPLDLQTPLFSWGNLELEVVDSSISDCPIFSIRGVLQGQKISGDVSLSGLEIAEATFIREGEEKGPPWPYFNKDQVAHLPHYEEKGGILLTKSFQDNGIKIGDAGYLAYSSPTATGVQELHIPVYIAGFYDPGIMAVGNKCILVSSKITQAINASESPFTLDRSEANSLLVWFPHLKDALKIKMSLLQKFQEKGIAPYWKAETFREYEFAKDLMQQFESDKYLFTLIGIIILLVACTNIISLLILLVSDKKKEIGILLAMGATRKSIATIFAACGASLGLFSCLLGIFLAALTLKNIDSVVHFLSLLQGHEAFNPQFFGQSLPHTISSRALLFAALATPLLALIAGFVPAVKAARLNPCETLRSE